jgi:thiol-disulfide isomerase/thioredoxin
VPLVSLITVVVALTAASAVGVAWQRRNGRFRTGSPQEAQMATPVLAELGWRAGTPLTLIQFSSAFCAPCRATRVLCEQAAATVPGVTHLEVDAESHLAAVRELGILRTPTVLLVDADGQVARRASGQPTRVQLMGAIAGVLGEFTTAQ